MINRSNDFDDVVFFVGNKEDGGNEDCDTVLLFEGKHDELLFAVVDAVFVVIVVTSDSSCFFVVEER